MILCVRVCTCVYVCVRVYVCVVLCVGCVGFGLIVFCADAVGGAAARELGRAMPRAQDA